jgi:hypothetical protein
MHAVFEKEEESLSQEMIMWTDFKLALTLGASAQTNQSPK